MLKSNLGFSKKNSFLVKNKFFQKKNVLKLKILINFAFDMNKKKLIILISVVTISLTALIVFQYILVKKTTAFYDQTFSDVVERTIRKVEQDIKEIEVKKLIDETLEENIDYDSICMKPDILNFDIDNELKINHKHNKNYSIQGLNKIITEKYKNQYLYNKYLINRVITKMMMKDNDVDISNRINFNDMLKKITMELEENNIKDKFMFYISTGDGTILFSNHYSILDKNRKTMRQQVFTANQSGVIYANLIFSNNNSYKRQFFQTLFPTICISIFLFILVIITLYILLIQRRDADIKSDFLNNMTHELKTPIASISTASQMLNDGTIVKSPERMATITKAIKEETQRLSVLVDKVLQTSIFESQQSILNLREDDVNELIYKVIRNFSININANNGKINYDLRAENPFAMVDNVHFTNVIYNLFENSVKYTIKNLILSVNTWNEKDKLFISISDNGIGIKKDDLKRIFERFYRVSTGNLHNVKGFGLGLAYVKKIINEHKGTINVESEYGVGTKFVIQLPSVKI